MKENISIHTEFIKLGDLLKMSSIAITGGQAKIIISTGEVFVNEQTCTMRGKKIIVGDIVRYKDVEINVIKEN